MRIYVDMDDVLCETAARLCVVAAREFGRNVKYEDVRDFELKRVFRLDEGEMAHLCEIAHSYETLAGYQRVPGAVEGMKALVAAGHKVDVVTGRPPYTNAGTKAWLEAAGLGSLEITYADKYSRHWHLERFSSIPPFVPFDDLRERHYDLAIDDSPVAVERLSRWEGVKTIVLSRPWNVEYPLPANAERADDWAQILRLAKIREVDVGRGAL